MQTLGVSVKQLRRKLLELGARILHVQGSKPRDMALVVRDENVLFVISLPPVASSMHPRPGASISLRTCDDATVVGNVVSPWKMLLK